jgi:predicted 3-demethylubiquinone-9 3-methyltransferase (glyoxalase superfamily)
MRKIVPHLWYDKEAEEAVALYTSVFENSKVTHTSTLDGPAGETTTVVAFELRGMPFMAISAGPYFKLNPAISLMVNYDPKHFGGSAEEARSALDRAWALLAPGGTVRMELGEYPFSKHYGWVEDKYGLNWQLILTNPEGEERPPIVPSLLFVGEKCGTAEEAVNFYTSVFKDAKAGAIARYGAGMEPDKEGTVMFTDFRLYDTWFAAMDSAHEHNFDFNEALSFIVYCEDQAEIDYYWEKLSAAPDSEQCGWLKDKFGVSWQILPKQLHEMLSSDDKEAVARVTKAFLPMKKMNVAELEKAYKGV